MEARRRALGRGLGALIPVSDGYEDIPQDSDVATVAVEDIVPNPFQPREVFSEDAIEELAASIRSRGLLQPLLVRRAGDRYQLIAGERRFRASQRAGLARVPVVVRAADDREMLELALIENLQRENLNPIEEALAYQRLIEEFSLTHEEIAQHVGKSRPAVANSLRLLQLPADVREQLSKGLISAGHARSLLALSSPTDQAALAGSIIEGRLSVRDTEVLVRKHARPEIDVEQKAVEADLSQLLGTRVRIRPRKGGAGRIEIDYFSLAELNGLIVRLTDGGRPAGLPV
jgi:ParB family chromosome partitioning protein